MTARGLRIGVDLGGTKIEAIALDAAGNEIARHRLPTPRDDYDATLEAVAALVHRIESSTGGHVPVGVGTPGAESRVTGRIKNANSTWLNGRPLAGDLARILGRPVRLTNDANCFALSEARDGNAAGAAVVFGVILGTGTGGGVVVRGEPLTGINAVAGEWGHNPLPWPDDDERPGPPCWCGHRGCIETWLSGPGLSADHAARTGLSMAPPDIVRRSAGGDAQCEATLQRYEQRLARALATMINILDPDVIVLGGGLSNIRRLYDNVPRAWARYVFSDRVDTRLAPPAHGDSSGVRGAAWLWPD